MIDQVAALAGLAGAASALHADRAETVDADTGPSGFIIQVDAAFHEFIVGDFHPGSNPAGRSGRAQEQNPGKPDRQTQPGGAAFDGCRAGGKYLQRTVEQHRMQRILCRTMGNRFG